MINLDDPNIYNKLDKEGMLDHIRNLPQMCRRAWQLAESFILPEDYSAVNKVVVLGMGGSAIGGDLAASLVADESKVPVIVHRGYDLPAFIDENTLVIASSYSGITEETLCAFRQALDTKAKKLVITTGGKLKILAEEQNIPVFCFDYSCQPRAALPFSLLPILNFMQRLGFIQDISTDVSEMVAAMEQLSSKTDIIIPVESNKAKRLAQNLCGKLAVIYGAGITAEVAHRWKTQLNENSKAWAFHEALPELNHNAIVGYCFPQEMSSNTAVVMLKSSHLPPPVALRCDITSQLLDKADICVHMVNGSGNSALAQVMCLVLFGDYVSFYLAILNNTDPTPVDAINFLKSEMSKNKKDRDF